jgi:signal transduction histidine kinase
VTFILPAIPVYCNGLSLILSKDGDFQVFPPQKSGISRWQELTRSFREHDEGVMEKLNVRRSRQMTTNKQLQKAERLNNILYPAGQNSANGNGKLYNNFFPTVKSGLQWLTNTYEEQSGIRMEFKNGKGPVDVDRDINFLIFHATNELLTAIYQHGTAKNVLVSIESTGQNIKVSVEDDGEGFDVSDSKSLMAYSEEHSLKRLNEELKALGGRLSVESEEDEGTRVTIFVPPYAAENCGTRMIM